MSSFRCLDCGADLSDIEHIIYDPNDTVLIDDDGTILSSLNEEGITHHCLKCSPEDVIVNESDFKV